MKYSDDIYYNSKLNAFLCSVWLGGGEAKVSRTSVSKESTTLTAHKKDVCRSAEYKEADHLAIPRIVIEYYYNIWQ